MTGRPPLSLGGHLVAVTESMDVRIMQNAPYAANQH
jgi:hypothetical protein